MFTLRVGSAIGVNGFGVSATCPYSAIGVDGFDVLTPLLTFGWGTGEAEDVPHGCAGAFAEPAEFVRDILGAIIDGRGIDDLVDLFCP